MADVTVDSSPPTAATARAMRSIVFSTAAIGYAFFINSAARLAYKKTTDGGATWGANTNINNSAATTVLAFDVWFDQWTPGDTGTLIHVWHFDATNDTVFWRTLDTNGDTLGTERSAFVGASAVAGRGAFCSGTKTRSGYLYVAFDIDAGAEHGIVRSTDSGTTWSSNLATSFVEATIDQCKLFPATGTGDNNDCWAIYQDASADALTMKMWDSSAAAEVESSTMQTMVENTTDGTGQMGFDGSVRFSDGAIFVVSSSERDTATADMQSWEVTAVNAGSLTGITAKTDITTNADDNYNPQVFIDQDTNNIYVAYNGKRDGSETLGTTTKVYYTKSTDGGTSWSAGDTAYMEGAAAVVLTLWTPLTGHRFCAMWRISAGNNNINKVNSVCLYTLLPTQGSYSLTGETVLLERGRTITLVQGSYSLTGQAVSFIKGKVIAVVQGSYSLTGQAVNLLFKRIMSAVQGAYALTGQAVSLLFGRKIAITQGSYSLTGENVTLTFTPSANLLTASQGSYTLTGEPVSLLFGRNIAATQGSYSLSGQAVSLLFKRQLSVTQGAYVLTGEPVTLERGRFITATQGAYTLSGQNLAFLKGLQFNVAQGSYTLTGESVNLLFKRILSLVQGAYVLTGEDLTLSRGRFISVNQGDYALSGQAIGFLYGRFLTTEQGSYILTGETLELRIEEATSILWNQIIGSDLFMSETGSDDFSAQVTSSQLAAESTETIP